jgi:predicted RNase H-like HicB family nuclease
MKNIIQFFVSNEDNTYTAEGVNVPIVTEGKTFEELKTNILDAVRLFFKGEDSALLGFGPMPSILTSFELPSNLYGSNA